MVKRVAALLAALAPLGLLSACGPAVTAVSAIGYDTQGRLVGAVKVCHHRFSEASLAPTTPDGAPAIGSWHRDSSFTGTESWPLRGIVAGRWKPVGPALPELAPGTEYVFWSQDKDESSRSDFLVFHGSDLARLTPGQVLLRRDERTNSGDRTTVRLVVIPLSQLAQENCSG
jgi:hypothetical protein